MNFHTFTGPVVAAALLMAGPAAASVHIKPIYRGDVWTGKAEVGLWDDNKGGVIVRYPVLPGCAEAKDYMESTVAARPGAGMFGTHKTMTPSQVNKLLTELSNSPHLSSKNNGSYDWRAATRVYPYPSRAHDCGPSARNKFRGWY